MAESLSFTLLAVMAARDEASAIIERVSGKYAQLDGALKRTAETAASAGATVDESLLRTASGADALDLATARVQAAQAQVDATMREQAAAEQELLGVQARMAAGEMDAADAADRQVAALARLKAAQREVAAASKDLGAAEKLQSDTALAAAGKSDEAAAAQGRFSGLVSKGGAVLSAASKFAVGAGVAVGAIGYESVKAAMNFQTLTTQLVTTAGEAPSALGRVQQGLLRISSQTATSANDLSKSMYIVEAAGYNAAHGGLDVLKASTEGARLENSDFATVSNGVTDILKDYHLGANQAANVTSQLVAAVGHGKANFQQFSAALSNILPMGAAVHLKFNDLAGVLAEMTSHGVTAQRASQNMADALRHLEGPTGTMVKEFKAVGITSDEVQKHLTQQGLGGTLQWLSGIAKENAARLGQTYPQALKALMGTASGLNVALMTTGENAGDVNKAIGDIGKTTADSQGNVQGFADVQSTLGFKVEQAKQSIQNTGIAIGQALLPTVTKMLGIIDRVLVPITQWAQKHQKLIQLIFTSVGVMVAAAGAIKLVSIAMGILNAVMDANPITLIIIAIAGLVAAFIYLWNNSKAFRDFWIDMWHAIKTAAEYVWHFLDQAYHDIVQWSKDAWHGVQDAVEKAWNWIVSKIHSAVHDAEAIINWFGSLPGKFADWFDRAKLALVDKLTDGINWLKGLPGRILSSVGDLGSLLYNTGKAILNGLWNGLKDMWNNMTGWIGSIGGWISNLKGPITVDAVLLTPHGHQIMQGLMKGLKAEMPALEAQLGGVSATIKTGVTPTVPALSSIGARTTSGTTVIDMRGAFEGAYIAGDAGMRQFEERIGRLLATKLGPQGGLRLAT